MDKNQSLMLASVIFGIVALLHLLRSIFQWRVSIGLFTVPMYWSYIGIIIAGYLAWHMYSAGKK